MATDKREKTRLVKAELWLHLAVTSQAWANMVGGSDPRCRPFEEWENEGTEDPFHTLCRTYDLTPKELSRIIQSVSDQLETKALAAGYEHHWDPVGLPAGGKRRS